jgi:N-acetylglucosamine kinase-like BadF-type ATPase
LKSLNADKNIFVSSDAHITIEAAFSGLPGMILISGTGSVVFGKDESGIIHRSGGYGRIIGDEGSAYSIGRKALSLIARELDGIIDGSVITKLFVQKFGDMNTDKFINHVHADGFDIARVSIMAIQAAERGDAHALKIIHEETELLCGQVNSVFKKLNGAVSGLCLHGGLITNNKFYSDILKEKILTANSQITIKEPDYPPEIGAVIMAKNKKEISGVYSK